jgi:hypothetical protein
VNVAQRKGKDTHTTTKKSTHSIADKKKRGEWVEMRFVAEAAERGLPASKPFGDSENFDVVVGRPGKFVAVQVKCTIFPSKNGEGYLCSVCSSHNIYRPEAFDFLAALVVPNDVWYILPMKEIQGMRSVTLCTATGRYEKYREAWELLREAVGDSSEADGAEQSEAAGTPAAESPVMDLGRGEIHPDGGAARMQAAFAYMRRRLEK